MSYVKRKLKHQPTDVNELSQLLMKRDFIANEGDKKVTKVKSKKSVHFSRSATNYDVERKRSETIQSPLRDNELTRKSKNDLDKISVHVGNVTYEMDDAGDWIAVGADYDVNEEMAILRKSNLQTSQENNMLRVKNELLVDMIARKTLRKLQVEAEVQRLKKILSKSSSRFSVACENESN